jgi:single-stranded-DNA-specific exonuclease
MALRSDAGNPAQEQQVEAWRAELQAWRAAHPGPALAVHDYDADGLSAAALWAKACGGQLQSSHSRRHLPPLLHPAESVYLLDLSCGDGPLPWSQPTAVIDHHMPSATPPPCLMFNVHDWEPPACTSLLVHWLLLGADSPHAWIAAVGALSDLGDAAPYALLQNQLRHHGKTKMRDLVSLINSAHRAEGDPGQGLVALLEHPDPNRLLRSKHGSVLYLRDCQAKVRSRLNAARKAAPRFLGRFAVIEIESDCPVQSIVAQIWRSRLRDALILVANRRTDREEVQLSARCGASDSVVAELARLGLEVRGHKRSAGAILAPEVWETFLKNLEGSSH